MKFYCLILISLPFLAFAQTKSDTAKNKPVEVYDIFNVEQIPLFKGKMAEISLREYISDSLQYPDSALNHKIQTAVVLTFIINPDSSISEIKVLTPRKGYGLEEEAIRVLESTAGYWTPAIRKGEAVAVRFQVPIYFRIE